MKTHIIISLLLLLGLTASCQVAPTPANSNTSSNSTGNSKSFASAGCVELGGSFSFTSESYTNSNGVSSSPTTNVILFAPYVGYFPVQGIELGLNPFSVASTSFGSGGSSTSLLFMFAPSYNFNTHSIAYPFIEGEIGYTSTNDGGANESGISYGGRAGVKLAIAPHALLNIGLQYLVLNFNSNSGGSINNLVIGIGFTVYL
jgi:hypothetical protein